MKTLLLLFLIIPLFVQSQRKNATHTDSIDYYTREIDSITRIALDSVYKSEAFKQANERRLYHAQRADSYSAFMIFGEMADADFDNLNRTIVPKGFAPLKGPVYRAGFGMSSKTNQFVFDLAFAAFGFTESSKNWPQKLTTNFNSVFQVDFGYDLTKSIDVNIYPYAGAAFRSTVLKYSRDGQTNSAYTDITDILNNEIDINESSTKFGYQAGIGFDFVISRRTNRRFRMKPADEESPVSEPPPRTKDPSSGTIFFLKLGTNGAIGKSVYRIGNIDYRPGIHYGRWIVTAGFKFFGRQ